MAPIYAGLPRVLGDELRRARKRHGWTRKDLLARLGWNASLQTLATYELGTRTLSVARLAELADALDVSALDVLGRTLGRLGKVEHGSWLEIDLLAITSDQTVELAPLRRWARVRLNHTQPGRPTAVRFGWPTVLHLAVICGLSADKLISVLWSIAARHDTNDGQRTVMTIESASACHE